MKIRIDPLDALFSKMMRKKYPVCQACGRESSTQVHHFRSRKNQSVRFDPDNIWCVGFGCHRKFHEDPVWAVNMQMKRLGDRYDNFVLKSNMICKRYASDKVALRMWIEQETKK